MVTYEIQINDKILSFSEESDSTTYNFLTTTDFTVYYDDRAGADDSYFFCEVSPSLKKNNGQRQVYGILTLVGDVGGVWSVLLPFF